MGGLICKVAQTCTFQVVHCEVLEHSSGQEICIRAAHTLHCCRTSVDIIGWHTCRMFCTIVCINDDSLLHTIDIGHRVLCREKRVFAAGLLATPPPGPNMPLNGWDNYHRVCTGSLFLRMRSTLFGALRIVQGSFLGLHYVFYQLPCSDKIVRFRKIENC